MSARLKILFYVFFVVNLFFVRSLDLHLAIAAVIIVMSVTLLPFKRMMSGFIPITIFLIFTFAGNLFFHSGRIIYSNSFLSLTDDGLRIAGVRTLRVFSMLYGAKILTGLISIDEMVRSFEAMLRPLEKIGVPVRDFFSIMALTLKSFPVLMEYLGRTYREDLRNNDVKGFRKRMRHMASFMMPVFVKSIRSPESFFESGKKSGESSGKAQVH